MLNKLSFAVAAVVFTLLTLAPNCYATWVTATMSEIATNGTAAWGNVTNVVEISTGTAHAGTFLVVFPTSGLNYFYATCLTAKSNSLSISMDLSTIDTAASNICNAVGLK